jgi:hypothetical protein
MSGSYVRGDGPTNGAAETVWTSLSDAARGAFLRPMEQSLGAYGRCQNRRPSRVRKTRFRQPKQGRRKNSWLSPIGIGRDSHVHLRWSTVQKRGTEKSEDLISLRRCCVGTLSNFWSAASLTLPSESVILLSVTALYQQFLRLRGFGRPDLPGLHCHLFACQWSFVFWFVQA